MTAVLVVDYGIVNLKNILRGLEYVGFSPTISSDPKLVINASRVVLPGVGSFNDGMKDLNQNGLKEFLTEEIIDRKKPYLGICLGLEFLAKRSYEGGVCDGFGWIDSEIVKLQPSEKQNKVPHMGWNDTEIVKEHGLSIEEYNRIIKKGVFVPVGGRTKAGKALLKRTRDLYYWDTFLFF